MFSSTFFVPGKTEHFVSEITPAQECFRPRSRLTIRLTRSRSADPAELDREPRAEPPRALLPRGENEIDELDTARPDPVDHRMVLQRAGIDEPRGPARAPGGATARASVEPPASIRRNASS